MRLDDEYAGFAEKLLEAIYPVYRRPFPACAVARLTPGSAAEEWPVGKAVRAGAGAASRISFTTLMAVSTRDPEVTDAAFHTAGTFHCTSGASYSGPYVELTWHGHATERLRVFVDGDPSVVASLRDALGLGVKALLIPDPSQDGRYMDGGSVRALGFDDDFRVLDDPGTAHPGLRLLRELFAFPDKFGFFDLVHPQQMVGASSGRLIVVLDPGVTGDGHALERMGSANLLTRCVAVANIYRRTVGLPANRHAGTSFEIDAPALDILPGGLIAVDSVFAQSAGDVDVRREIPHFYALRRAGAGDVGPFWMEGDRNERTGAESIMFVDRVCEPVDLDYGVSLELRCCDGDRPSRIACGTPEAKISSRSETSSATGQLITRPTRASRFQLGKQATWRLVSQLAFTQVSLLEPSCSVLKQVIELYVPPTSRWGRQMVSALVSVRHEAVTRWLPGAFPPTLARGTEIAISIDETCLVGLGLHALLRVLDVFFSQYAQMNSFTELAVLSSHTGKELHRCAMRTGTGPLI
ncbi:type VI secretion system protein ImpG [Luteibacter sp. 22Crub2.1]|nr:type VI secretion system protein ImpG [Luteibacter sp. 22Crub2.1]